MFVQIIKNHIYAAKEHIKANSINHKPTVLQAIRITAYDFIFNKTIFHKESGSHLIYEVIKVPTLGLRAANVIRIYVPPEHRGNGIVSKMLDDAHKKEKVIISGKGKYGEVGRLCIARTYL